mgnify:CR=1 FL=1
MLQNSSKLIWIDHHKNVIDSLQMNSTIAAIPGIREDGIGACYLAWKYFFQDKPCPNHVKYAATADAMDRTGLLCSLKKALSYGLYLDEFGPGWKTGHGDVSKHRVHTAITLFNEKVCARGFQQSEQLEKVRQAHEDELFVNAHDISINGSKGCLVHIDSRPNACILSHLLNHTHDVFVCFGDKVGEKYKISLRVPFNSTFDASAFCRQYGGNGHIKAAGCLMSADEIHSTFGVQL